MQAQCVTLAISILQLIRNRLRFLHLNHEAYTKHAHTLKHAKYTCLIDNDHNINHTRANSDKMLITIEASNTTIMIYIIFAKFQKMIDKFICKQIKFNTM